MRENGLQIEMLGGFRIVRPGGAAVDIPCRQAAAVLAYLALNPRRTHAREELADLFWPDDGVEEGRAKLRKSLTAIRDWFAEAGVDPDTLLRAGRADVSLDPSAVGTDVREIEESIAAAARSKEAADRALLLTHAVDRYRGELLPGFYDEALLSERNRLARMHEAALHDLAAACEQTGELDRALDVARKAIARNPADEDAHCAAMRVYAAKGQPGSVARQYQDLERALAADCEEAPSDDTRRLMDSLTESAQRARGARELATPAPTVGPEHTLDRKVERPVRPTRRWRILVWPAVACLMLVALGMALKCSQAGQEPARGRLAFNGPATIRFGGKPHSLAFDGKNVWVTDFTAATVSRIRASDGMITATLPTASQPTAIAFDGAVIWIAEVGTNTVCRVRARDLVKLESVHLRGERPVGVCFDGANIWVAGTTSGTIEKIRPSDCAILGSVTVGRGSGNMLIVGTSIWVTAYHQIVEVRTSDLSVARRVQMGHATAGLAFDGTRIWVAEPDAQSVAILDPRDGSTTATIPVGQQPLSSASDQKYVYVGDWSNGDVYRIRASDHTSKLFYKCEPPSNMRNILWDGAHLWATCEGASLVRKL